MDNDYNTIKPVEGLQNITGLSPTRRREERKRRRNAPFEDSEESEQDLSESTEQTTGGSESTGDEKDKHSIDYRA